MPDIQLIFPPEEENIKLLFPMDNEPIDVGSTITFDDITGKLPVNRIENISGLMTASEAHSIWDNA